MGSLVRDMQAGLSTASTNQLSYHRIDRAYSFQTDGG
jgi:hypothetical protein